MGPCVVWKGFPAFPAHLRMRPVSRGNSRRSLVVGATCRKTPISLSALDKNPMLGHLFEGNPVDEGTKRRGLTPSCIVGKARKFHIQIDKSRVSWSPLSGLKGVQPPLPFGETTTRSPRSTMKRSPRSPQLQKAHVPQLFRLCSRAQESKLLSPCATAAGA